MAKKWIELFEGLNQGAIPFDGEGYIVLANFDADSSNYTVIELIGFKNVKNIVRSGDTVTFQSDGHKVFIAYEPLNYMFKFQEPYLREGMHQFPHRFNECKIIELAKRDRIFVSEKPYMSFGSFNVEQPEEGNFVYYLYNFPTVDDHIMQFIDSILVEDLKISKTVMPQVNQYIKANLEEIRKTMPD